MDRGQNTVSPALHMGRNVRQMAWVVDDLERAMAAWLQTNGTGPFFVASLNALVDTLTYRGHAVSIPDTRIRLALAQTGDTHIELIEQRCETPSVYRDMVPAGKTGFHHIAVFANDYDQELASYKAQGFDVATTGGRDDIRWSYVDTRPALGCMVELLDRHPFIEGFFDMVRDASIGWDGSDPIRFV